MRFLFHIGPIRYFWGSDDDWPEKCPKCDRNSIGLDGDFLLL